MLPCCESDGGVKFCNEKCPVLSIREDAQTLYVACELYGPISSIIRCVP